MDKNSRNESEKQAWIVKMQEGLPSTFYEAIEYLMRKGGAITRERKIISGCQLLFFGLVLAKEKLTYRELAFLGTRYQCSMSDTAWGKRIRGARRALNMILQYMLFIMYPVQRWGKLSWDITDGTSFRIAGGGNREIRLHVHLGENGQLKEVVITDQHGAESLLNFNFQPGEIVTADRAYGKKKQLTHLLKEGTPFLVRFSPRMITWKDERGDKLDIYALLKENTAPFERAARLEINGPLVRLLFFPIPQEQWQAIEKRRQQKIVKNQSKTPDKRTLLTSHWTLLATTLPQDYDAAQILHLYRLRWQIETYFKSLKQGLDFHQFRNCSTELAEAILLLNLIAWLITQYCANIQYNLIEDSQTRRRFSAFPVCKAIAKVFLDWVKANIPLGHSPSTFPLLYLLDHKRRLLFPSPFP